MVYPYSPAISSSCPPQVVDDILDFTQTYEQLGKPPGQDLASGNLTAPTLFAMRRRPELRKMIENQFSAEGGEGKDDLPAAIKLVTDFGIEDARRLAREEADMALAALKVGRNSDCLLTVCLYSLAELSHLHPAFEWKRKYTLGVMLLT